MRTGLLIIFGALLAGCGNELDTGYRPQKLGVTSEERRAYYAPQFSPDAMGASEGKANQAKARRPVSY